jgi:chemotaxis family two-component system response regulator Rcp1
MSSSDHHRSILVVENNPEHLRTIASVLQADERGLELTTVDNSAAALDFLNDRERIPSADLILLNLDLPAQQGYQFLQAIKTNPRLRRIPIIVMSDRPDPEIIVKTYAMQGNCHIIKAPTSEQLAQIVQRIEAFWLGVVTLPLE